MFLSFFSVKQNNKALKVSIFADHIMFNTMLKKNTYRNYYLYLKSQLKNVPIYLTDNRLKLNVYKTG